MDGVGGIGEGRVDADDPLDIKEEVSIKAEEAIDIKEENPESIVLSPVKTEHEVRLWGVS
jgi:hypothetical protein